MLHINQAKVKACEGGNLQMLNGSV